MKSAKMCRRKNPYTSPPTTDLSNVKEYVDKKGSVPSYKEMSLEQQERFTRKVEGALKNFWGDQD